MTSNVVEHREASGSAGRLNQLSIAAIRGLFKCLPPAEPAALAGVHQAEFVGPAWFRGIAPRSLALGGLGGWWGKSLAGDGMATNLVQRDGALRPVLRMLLSTLPSRLDGQPGATLSYPPGSPLPWCWVVDELRPLEDGTLLCLTIPTRRGLPRLALPFLLHRRPDITI